MKKQKYSIQFEAMITTKGGSWMPAITELADAVNESVSNFLKSKIAEYAAYKYGSWKGVECNIGKPIVQKIKPSVNSKMKFFNIQNNRKLTLKEAKQALEFYQEHNDYLQVTQKQSGSKKECTVIFSTANGINGKPFRSPIKIL